MRRVIVVADAIHVTLATLLTGAVCVRVVQAASDLAPGPFCAGLVLGFLAADFASGVMHWFCDTYFHPRTRLIGSMIIAPFREHHVDPGALGRHGVLERNGNNCLAALPLLWMAFSMFGTSEPLSLLREVERGGWLGSGLTLALTNQIHALAHATCAPRAARWLQRSGLLLTPEHHATHHRGGRAYAVVCGWSNPVLDRLLPRFESLLARAGLRPDRSEAGR